MKTYSFLFLFFVFLKKLKMGILKFFWNFGILEILEMDFFFLNKFGILENLRIIVLKNKFEILENLRMVF